MINLNKIVKLEINYSDDNFIEDKFIFENNYADGEIIDYLIKIIPKYIANTMITNKIVAIITINDKIYNYDGGVILNTINDQIYKSEINEIYLGGEAYLTTTNNIQLHHTINRRIITKSKIEINKDLSNYLIKLISSMVDKYKNVFIDFSLVRNKEKYYVQYDSSDNYFWFEKAR